MEFNFETPLILRLRKIAHSKTVLWCGILFLTAVCFFAAEKYLDIYFYGNTPFDLFDAFETLFRIFLTIPFFAVFISARNKDSILPTGGFTASGILCLLAGIIPVVCNVFLRSHVKAQTISIYCRLFSYPPAFPGMVLTDETFYMRMLSIIICSVTVLFCFILAATFFSATSVARNNKPKRFFPILLTLISFIISAFYIIRFVYFLVIGDFIEFYTDLFNDASYLPFQHIVCSIIEFLREFILCPAITILCGCVGIGFAKASRRIK